ncbi:MAG: hypothetical protein AAB524_01610 [Patescibacteria group bacterium]
MQNDNVKFKVLLVILVLLLASNVFFAMQYIATQHELQEVQAALETQNINEKTLAFTQLFIEKVLKSETEVDFETRLQLENNVRGMGDQEILTQWQKFTESKNEQEAQKEVKNLLGVLMAKIKI